MQRTGIKVKDYFLPSAAPGEKNVYWTMKISYAFQGYSNSFLRKDAEIHLVRIKKSDDPEGAIQKILERYQREAASGGDLNEAFVYDITEKHLRGQGGTAPLTDFTVEKIGGPYTVPDEACNDIVVYFSQAGMYEWAEHYRNPKPENPIKVVWDNPKPDDQMYFIFWE